MEIKVFKKNEKLNEAYDILVEKINNISKQYQLNYFELFGLIECFRCDLIVQSANEED